jgi:hypothetical protein
MEDRVPVARTTRATRFPAVALKLLLATRPFPSSLWQTATSAALSVRIGNAPALSGQGECLEALSAFLDCTAGFASGFCEFWAVKEAIYIETELDYIDRGDTIMRIPCSVIARTTHGLVHDLRFHLDPSPLPGYRCPSVH